MSQKTNKKGLRVQADQEYQTGLKDTAVAEKSVVGWGGKKRPTKHGRLKGYLGSCKEEKSPQGHGKGGGTCHGEKNLG